MRISIKTDPGWSLLVAKLHNPGAEVCNYIPLNNWNHCPPAISSSNWVFNITSFYIYIYHIFYTLCLWQWSQKTFIVLEWHSEEALTINRWQCWLGQIFTAFSPQTCALLAVTHDSNRPCHLMLADTITVIWKAVVVLCVRVRCSGHSDLVNCLRGFMEVQLQSRSCQFITTAL